MNQIQRKFLSVLLTICLVCISLGSLSFAQEILMDAGQWEEEMVFEDAPVAASEFAAELPAEQALEEASPAFQDSFLEEDVTDFFSCVEADAALEDGEAIEAFQAEDETVGDGTSGSCGESLKWKFDNHTLTIYGTGNMTNYDYESNKAPWRALSSTLTAIEIENGATSIGDFAFYSLPNLSRINIGTGVTAIGQYAFCKCTSLDRLTLPSSLKTIGVAAFSHCSSLGEVVIPDGVTKIEDAAFYNCNSLNNMLIPDSVTTLGAYAFYECNSLKKAVIGNGVQSIGEHTFYSCDTLSDVVIGNAVSRIGYRAFYECRQLIELSLGTNIVTIGNESFRYCQRLQSLVIPYNVTSIGKYAFNYCKSLTKIVLGENVIGISAGAFEDCTSLSTIYIQKYLSDVESNAFANCNNLATVYYSGSQDNWSYVSIKGGNDSLIKANFVYGFESPTAIPTYTPAPTVEPTATPKLTAAPTTAPTTTPAPSAFDDDAFENAVHDALGIDEEDEITDDLCKSLDGLDVSRLGIKSLKGIEKFTNLTYLDCSGNELTSLDVSKLTQLAYLDCSKNELTSLDVRKNKKLEYLDVRDNNFSSSSAVLLPGEIDTYLFDEEEAENTPTPTIPPASISLNKTKSTLYVGSSAAQLTLKAKVKNLTNAVSFSSSDTSVATVSSKGVVKAVKKGSAVITASVSQYGQTYKATCKITVKTPSVKVASKLTVKVGKTATLKVTIKPSGTVTYKSADAKIATVSKYGVVKGIKKGKTTITVTCNGVSKKVKVTVKK